jgi:L-lactate dehydrogenase complex protein LldG
MLDRVKNRGRTERQQLLEKLIEMAQPIHLRVLALNNPTCATAAIIELVRDKVPEWGQPKNVAAWRHPLVESLNLPQALASQNVPVYFSGFEDLKAAEDSGATERQRLRKQVIDSFIGVTSADFCMADTASLVMRARPGQARSVSLLPTIHIAVIRLDQIIADLKELYALLCMDPEVKNEGLTNCMTFISGPSKTADVEATMVHGAHGPREVYIYVITQD